MEKNINLTNLTLLQTRVILKALINDKQPIAWFIDSLPNELEYKNNNIIPVVPELNNRMKKICNELHQQGLSKENIEARAWASRCNHTSINMIANYIDTL